MGWKCFFKLDERKAVFFIILSFLSMCLFAFFMTDPLPGIHDSFWFKASSYFLLLPITLSSTMGIDLEMWPFFLAFQLLEIAYLYLLSCALVWTIRQAEKIKKEFEKKF